LAVLVPPVPPSLAARWDAATEAERARAAARLGLLREAEAYAATNRNGKKERAALLAQFLTDRRAAGGGGDATRVAEERDRIPRSLGTLYRWIAFARETDGHPAALLDARLARRADGGPAHAAIPEPAKSGFLGLYLNTHQLSAKECYRATAALLRGRGEPTSVLPDYRAFLRLLQAIPEEVRVRHREGERAWAARYRPYIERDPTTLAVNEWWVTDHMLFDLVCRLPDGRLGRPWLTEWMDIRSRRRLGWCVAATPSQDTILLALARGIRRGGIPGHVYMDNGRDFTSTAPEGGHRRIRVRLDEVRVESLLAHLQVVPHFSRPGNPQSRLIERWFGTAHTQFDKWFPTYCGRDAAHKPEDLPAVLQRPADIPTLEQVGIAYGLYVERIANVEPSEARGLDNAAPLDVWQAGVLAPGYVHRTATDEELKLLLMKTTKLLAVRRGAVEFARRRWSCPALQEPGAPTEVYGRYDQDVAGRLWLFTAQDEFVGVAERDELLAYGAGQEAIRKAERLKQGRSRLAKAWREELTAQAAQPDDVLRAALPAMLAAAPAPAPDPKPAVVRPLRTPFRKAAKALKAVEAAGTAKALPPPLADPRDLVLDELAAEPIGPEPDGISDYDRAQMVVADELPARPAKARRQR
jgi:transposase InsO family protein